MTIYLRDRDNNTLLDISIWEKGDDGVDLRSNVIIKHYSKFLLENPYRRHEVIKVFDDLSELRGWLHERYLSVENSTATKDQVIIKVTEMLKIIAKDFKLNVVTD